MDKKIYTKRECIKIVKNNGFIYIRSKGGHDIYKRNNETLSVPSNYINPMLFRRLMREHNLKEIY